MYPKFAIAHITDAEGPITWPWRILETYMTSDGPRTRLSDKMFVTWKDADTEFRALLAGKSDYQQALAAQNQNQQSPVF